MKIFLFFNSPIIPRRFFAALLFLISFLFLVLSGCNRYTLGSLNTIDTAGQFEEESIDQRSSAIIFNHRKQSANTTEADTSTRPLYSELAGDKVEDALYYCEIKSYDSAYTSLTDALKYLDSSATVEEFDDSTELDQLYDEVARIFSDSLPSSYFDKIPENIALFVLNRQLSMSFDSTALSTFDSVQLTALVPKVNAEVVYDIPVAWNPRVQKALAILLKRGKGNLSAWLTRANYYLPVMKKMFADSGIPTDLAYLPLIESGFNSNAYSWAHASGIWQFIQSTGRHYGLRNDYWFDERRDPLKSTSSAVSYLKKLYGDFSDWHLALAAYNCGENRVGSAINQAQVSNYWQIKLPQETENYVPYYLAALIIAKNPAAFGISIPDVEPFAYDTFYVKDCIPLDKVAKTIGIDSDELKKINPHILRWCTPPDQSNVLLYLPKGTAPQFTEYYSSLPSEDKIRWYRYKVRKGESISGIAQKFNTTTDFLKEFNNLTGTKIASGRYIFVPVAPDVELQPELRTVLNTDNAPESKPGTASYGNGRRTVYRVRSGETIYGISKKFGVSSQELCKWNKITKQNRLMAGQKLVIYKKGSSVSTTVAHSQSGTTRTNTALKTGISYRVKPGENLTIIAQKFQTSVSTLMACNNFSNNDNIQAGQLIKVPSSTRMNATTSSEKAVLLYTVRAGDNLYSIARNFNIPVKSICENNNIGLDTLIRPGDKLRIIKRKDS
jgi:membrane-bound lytic murein transglycosylase D